MIRWVCCYDEVNVIINLYHFRDRYRWLKDQLGRNADGFIIKYNDDYLVLQLLSFSSCIFCLLPFHYSWFISLKLVHLTSGNAMTSYC
jgi:hypothetical protein